jgi:hypothetical protein
MAADLFVPKGADASLPEQPTAEEIVAGETGKGAKALWDRLMPQYAGMLNAEVVESS